MIKIKSISKRALAMILAIMMMLSCGIISAVAANVELAPTGYDLKCVFIYDNSKTQWSSVQLLVGHSSWSQGYKLTRISNTDLWYYNMSSTWGGATQIAIFNASSTWGGEGNSVSSRLQYMDKNSAAVSLSGNMTDGIQLLTPPSTATTSSDNFTLTTTYKSSYSGLNSTQTAEVYAKALGATSYTSNSDAGSVSISTYELSSSTSSTASTGTTSASAARTATVTMKATANSGYQFVGWYNTSGTLQTTSETLTYTCSGSAATYRAYFDEQVTEVNATFKDWDDTQIGEVQTVTPGATPTAPANPSRTGYTFLGWNTDSTATTALSALPAITADTTFYAIYSINTPAKPTSVTLEVLNAYAGTGTQDDPYLVLPDEVINTKITCSTTDTENTTGYLYNVNYTAAWATGDAGVSEFYYDGLARLSNGVTGEYIPYAWAYNGTEATKSEMLTGETVYIMAAYQSITATFVDYDGALIDEVEVEYGGKPTPPADPTREGYTFAGWTPTVDNITDSITYTATYTPNKHSVSITSVNGKATVTPQNDDGTVNYNDEITVSVTPDAGYKVSSVVINNGVEDITGNTATVKGNVTVTVTYEAIVYHTIAIQQTGGTGTVTSSVGTISNNQLNVEEGTTVTLTFKAPSGYYISNLNGTANTVQSKTEDSVTISAIAQDETVTVEYAVKTEFTVTVVNSNADAGTYEIDNTTGFYGDTFTIEATANEGYVFDGFTVNGTTKTDNPLTMNITGDITVTVNWKEQGWEGIIYVENRASWSNVYAYTWKTANNEEFNGAWPGGQMTQIGTNGSYPVYAIRVPIEKADLIASTYNVIFNNNSGTQLGEITLSNDVNYYIITSSSATADGYHDIDVTLPINVYLDNGANKHYQISGTGYDYTIGLTTVDTTEDSVISMSAITQNHRYDGNGARNYYDTGYYKASVNEGQSVTITTTIQSNATEYMVDGFLINATEFIPANYMGNGVYQATYSFTEDGTVVVPIYSYTDEYLNENDLTEITLFAQKPDDFDGDWGDYMAAYVWYDKEGSNKSTTDYIFGAWPGQVMIPVSGVDNYWYTNVTTTSANGYPASGITFSNYGGWENDTGVLYPVTNTTNIQVYDYYEFITLAEDNADNITFVLKKGDGDNGGGSSATITDGNFTNYVDISGKTIDIYGEDIASDAEIGLYVIRNAPVSSTDAPLSGNYYVECSLYKADGTYIGQCFSYELLDIDTLATKLSSDYLANLSGKRVRIDYETMIHSSNNDGNSAKRYDGQWYNAVVEVELSVNVALTTDNGATYSVTSNTPANSDTYGEASVGGGEVYVAERNEVVTLSAVPASGYKFIGWYAANGTRIATSTTTTVNAVIETTYTAVFQELGDGEFIVTHEIYNGGGTSAYIPTAHGGRADLYIGIVNNTTGETFTFTKTGQGSVSATEGDELTITIGTDPLGVNGFYAWYIDALDKYGLTTYEEVGVDNFDGSGVYGNLYDNQVDTVEGSSDLVCFQFKYVVKEDLFNISLYSDVVSKSANAQLVYKYDNRFGEVRTVVVPYVLSDDEIDGCEGNGYKPMTPTQDTIYAKAPYVEDFYKDTTWVITDALYNTLTFELWATQPETVYTVTVNAGGSVSYKSGVFNAEVEINARDLNSTLTNDGFWYIDVANYYQYDEGIDQILSYGTYYGLRITDNMMIGYQTVDSLDFGVLLGEAEYGREQNTDDNGNNKTDFIYIDYIESFLIPYFNGDTTEDGKKINGVYYNDELIPTANTSVTMETLEKLGYSFDYGLIMEQINPALVNNYWGKSPASKETLVKVAEGEKGFVDNTDNSRYYTISSAKNNFALTNKNRLLFTIKMDNTSANQSKYYNVYGYLAVTDTTGVTSYYFSNMQTLNILDIGTSEGESQSPNNATA